MAFPKLKLSRSCALSLSTDPSYVLHFAEQKIREDGEIFAAAVSGTNEIKLYSKDTFCSKGSFIGHKATITAIKFDILHPDIIWSTSLDGTVRYWDTASKTSNEGNIVSSTDNVGFISMDICADGSILAVGTEKLEETLDRAEKAAFVEFWDIRKVPESPPKLLSTFEDIHSDDITKILFHPTNPKVVVTGSLDGLVSVLDLTTYDVDDALTQTLNTECSVNTVGFFGPSYEFLYVLSHNESLQIWKYQEGDRLTNMADVRNKVPKSNAIDYVVDCIYHDVSQRLFLIGGTHSGNIEIMHINMDTIEPYQSLQGGHSSTIRCIHNQVQCLLTGAEDGMVCAWMEMIDDGKAKKKANKLKSQKKKAKGNPYRSKGKSSKT